MIGYLNKMIASVVWSFSKGSKEKFVFNIAFFGAKFLTSTPIAILLFSIIDSIFNFRIFNSRAGSFTAIMLIYPIVDFFTIKKTEIKRFISQTSEEKLTLLVDQFRYGVVAVILLILGFIILFDKYIFG